MVKYQVVPTTKCNNNIFNIGAKAKAEGLRVHFKNTYEVARTLRGMQINRAKKYLNNVLRHKEIVPFRKYNRACGRKPGAKMFGTDQGKWPVKSVYAMLKLLKNAEANAKKEKLKIPDLYISHLTVQQAPTIRRRTFRAHGRINSWVSSPCHVHVILSEKAATTKAPEKEKKE
jgi:large subunit ribosomal protein L17e